MTLRFWSYSVDGTPAGDAHPKGEMASFIWAHGEAEDFVGVDLLHTDSFANIDRLTTGTYPVVVLNHKHTVVQAATLFFARMRDSRHGTGLVVLDTDITAIAAARRTLSKVRTKGGSMGFLA